MKKLNVIEIALGLSVAASALSGCGKNSASSTPTVQQPFKMTSSFSPSPLAQNSLEKLFGYILPTANAATPVGIYDSANRSINLSSAWVIIEKIKLKTAEVADASEDMEGEDSIAFKGPYYVDLLANTPIELDKQMLPKVSLRRIELKLHKTVTIPAGAPAGLNNNSMYFAGTVGASTFSYSSDDTTNISIAGRGGVLPDPAKDLLVVIRFADVFKKIDLNALTSAGNKNITASNRIPATNACPSIDASANDLYRCIRRGMETSSEFGEDSGDGDLDDPSDDSSKNAE